MISNDIYLIAASSVSGMPFLDQQAWHIKVMYGAKWLLSKAFGTVLWWTPSSHARLCKALRLVVQLKKKF